MTRPNQYAIVAALPREIAAFVRKLDPALKSPAELRKQGIWLYQFPQAVVVSAGMGAARVSLAVKAALEAQPGTTELISVGLAGSCDLAWAPGMVTEPGVAIDVQTGERFACDTAGANAPILATTPEIAGVREKQRLAATYAAHVVDMEAATVGRLARAKELRFSMVKAISDGPEFELGDLGRFADRQGQFRTAAFAWYTALRPGTWKHAVELGRNSKQALDALTARLLEITAAAR